MTYTDYDSRILAAIDSGNVVELVPSMDASALASGDVAFATEELENVTREEGGAAILISVTLIDKNDQGIALDLVFFNENVAIGTENSTPDISDALAEAYVGHVSITASEFIDLGGVRVATLKQIGLEMQCAAGSTSLYVAGIARGTPTYTAAGQKFKFGFI